MGVADGGVFAGDADEDFGVAGGGVLEVLDELSYRHCGGGTLPPGMASIIVSFGGAL